MYRHFDFYYFYLLCHFYNLIVHTDQANGWENQNAFKRQSVLKSLSCPINPIRLRASFMPLRRPICLYSFLLESSSSSSVFKAFYNLAVSNLRSISPTTYYIGNVIPMLWLIYSWLFMCFTQLLSENMFCVFLTLHCDCLIVFSTQWRVSFLYTRGRQDWGLCFSVSPALPRQAIF